MITKYNITIYNSDAVQNDDQTLDYDRIPGSISPFMIPMTSYVYFRSRRLNDFTSIVLYRSEDDTSMYSCLCFLTLHLLDCHHIDMSHLVENHAI